MIDQEDERMLAWARRVVPDVPVSIAPPPSADAGAGVRIHLLSLAPVPAARGAKRPPLELALRYLVTTNADDEADAHRWLGVLAFDAMDVRDWSVESDPPDTELWRAFEIAPRAAFVVRVPLRLPRNDREAPLVRKPLVLDMHSTTSLVGTVSGPEDIPIAGASLEIPSLQLFARTDEDGAFRFPQLPATSSVTLIVRAKRQTRTLRAKTGEALHIRIEGLEG
jgi:hypothetical protein